MKKQRKIIVILILIILGLLGFTFYSAKSSKPEITTAGIEARIQNISELAGAKLTYRGLITYSEGDIPILTKKGFSMIYTADIRAGIDFSKIEISHTEDTIKVICPKAEILDVNVDPDSIAFYDKKSSLFNWRKEEDTAEALKAAKKDAIKNADESSLLEDANKNIKGLLEAALQGIPAGDGQDYKISIEQ